MDFSALKSIQSQTRNLNQGREAESRRAYEEGLALFQTYNQNPDKEQLKQAMGKMLESIQFKRNHLEPYLMMATVYNALESPKQAIKFFRLAQQLAPQDKRVAQLRDVLSKGTKAQTIQASSAKSALNNADEEYDHLFHEVETLLQGELTNYLHELNLPSAPDWNPEVLKRLENYLLEMKFYGMEIDLKLQLMEEELDTLNLKIQYRSFEAQRRRTLLLHSQCQRFSKMKSKMDETLEKVKKEKAAPHSKNLEAILDNCDAFADQLDAFSDKNIPIDSLHPIYRHLLGEVTKLQEALDDSL